MIVHRLSVLCSQKGRSAHAIFFRKDIEKIARLTLQQNAMEDKRNFAVWPNGFCKFNPMQLQ
jgi:hypothetical protein